LVGEAAYEWGDGMITSTYDPNRWRLGVTETTPRPKPPAPVRLKPTKRERKDALRAAFGKHFPQLMPISDRDFRSLTLIPYKVELIDRALDLTYNSSSFGGNKQYSASNVIAYARAIARCLAGNSPLKKGRQRTNHVKVLSRRTTPQNGLGQDGTD
jgi:hypothetical protein